MGKVTTDIDWTAVRRTRHLKRRMKPPKISKAVKYGLAFFNGLFWGLSLLLISAGAMSVASSDTAAIELTSIFNVLLNISVALLLIGVIMFVISLAGILGTLRENIMLLTFYKRCVIGFIFAEFGLAMFCFAFPNYALGLAGRDLPEASIVHYRDDVNMQNLLDFIQQDFRCCGVSEQGFLDWNLNMYFNCSETNPSAERCSVPWSCCLEPDKTPIRDLACGNDILKITAFEAMKSIHVEGCIDAVFGWMKEHAHIVAASCVAVAFAQVAVMYQASRICIILQRMQPKPPPRPSRPENMLSTEMVMWTFYWLTGCWPPPEDDFDKVPENSRHQNLSQNVEIAGGGNEKMETKDDGNSSDSEKEKAGKDGEGEQASGLSSWIKGVI